MPTGEVILCRILILLFVATAVSLYSQSAAAQGCDPDGHIDVAVLVENGQIKTGIADYEINPPNPTILSGIKVWGSRYQEDIFDPYFTDDPGFAAISGSGLPAGSQVGWNALDDFRYWDGTGSISFGAVPNSEKMRIRLGGQSRCVGTGTGFVNGFNMAVVGSGGTIHVHIGFFLLGSDAVCSPFTAGTVPPTNGIYLLKLELKNNSTSPVIVNSDPMYIVFNNGLDNCLFCSALSYVGAQLAIDRARADLDFDRDVDVDDHDQFAACGTRATIPWTDPCCQNADLDDDGDIDMDDFGLYQRCYTGPGIVGDLNCIP